MRLKVFIFYRFTDKPFGGANQFLLALRGVFERWGIFTDRVQEAACVLFNSHLVGAGGGYNASPIVKLKRRCPHTPFVHRVDGPVSAYRQSSARIDHLIYTINDAIADGTVFQSHWSMEANRRLGMPRNAYEVVITNAPDPGLFHRQGNTGCTEGRRTRLIATSWSDNPRKGFDIYCHLDDRLDFARYEMSFVGRSPVRFRNIKMTGPLTSAGLAEQLRAHDIFVLASKVESCSNALVEALHCGLPAVVYDGGSNVEVAGAMGAAYRGTGDVIEAIDWVAGNIERYRAAPPPPDIERVATMYKEYLGRIVDDVERGSYRPKRASIGTCLGMLAKYGWFRAVSI